MESKFLRMSHLVLPIMVAILAVTVTTTPLESRQWYDTSYFYLDVMSHAPVEDVKAALDGLKVEKAYKVEGVGRYIFFVLYEGPDTVANVKFPDKSEVVVTHVIPAKSYFMFPFKLPGWDEPDSLDDDNNLMFIRWNFDFPVGTDLQRFYDTMVKFDSLFSNGFEGHKSWAVVSQGIYSVKFRAILNMSDVEAEKVMATTIKEMGVGSIGKVYVRHLIRI